MGTDHTHTSRLKRLVRAGTIATVGASSALTLPTCTTYPRYAVPSSSTDAWVVPEDASATQARLIEDYKKAWQAFEQATDNALRDAKTLKDRILQSPLAVLKGVDIVFCPPTSDGKNGSCVATAKSSGEKISDIDALIPMFKTYKALCEFQNQITTDTANAAGLSAVPSGKKQLKAFLESRITNLPGEERVADVDISYMAGFLDRPLNAACTFFHIKPEFKRSAERDDFKRLRELLEQGNDFSVRYDKYALEFKAGSQEEGEFVDIPTPLQILELKRYFPESSSGYQALDTRIQYITPPEQTEIFSYDKDISAFWGALEVPARIYVRNPNYQRAPGVPDQSASRTR